ncbi:MAG: hypothetical protein U5K76_10480 [Woeseiaceae bacterium]|nr:hypothetical protein [Woeseiaceae bacterium]
MRDATRATGPAGSPRHAAGRPADLDSLDLLMLVLYGATILALVVVLATA